MKKGIGDKVLGWFVVQEGEEGEEADARADAEAKASASAHAHAHAKADAHAEAKVERRAAAVVAPGEVHDGPAFGAVYRAAGVPDDERERLAKVLALIAALPDGATVEVKRAIVAASLEAFGVSIDRILVTGEGALAALDGYVVSGQNRTREVLAQAESRIAKLTAEIAEVRRLMDVEVSAQQELSRATAAEKARVAAVLAFFDGTASERVAAPRLVRLK